jgi:hypothetical protein
LLSRYPIDPVPAAAGYADGADAKTGFRFG